MFTASLRLLLVLALLISGAPFALAGAPCPCVDEGAGDAVAITCGCCAAPAPVEGARLPAGTAQTSRPDPISSQPLTGGAGPGDAPTQSFLVGIPAACFPSHGSGQAPPILRI